MKKILALVLTFALVFSSVGMAFADTTPATTTTAPATTTPAVVTDAQACTDIGMLKGDGNGVTAAYLATAPTRIQSAIMMLRLKGLEAEALAFTGTDNFADADKAAWAKPVMAYLKAHKELGWIGDGTNFDPAGALTAQAYYKVMLEALGYKQNTAEVVGDFAWDKTIEFAATVGLTKVATATNFTVDNMATATVEALKATVKGGTLTLAASLVAAGKLDSAKAIAAGVIPATPTVASVAIASAKSIKVTFVAPVADTTKAVFAVKKGATAMTVTATWNDAKTEATLANASNFAEATYSVNVAYDTKDLGTKDVAFTAQKVAKIEFTSPSVAVTVAGTPTGYVTFKVYDQYNNDITTTSMGNTLSSQVGVDVSGGGSVTVKNGLMTIIPKAGVNLMTFQSISVVLYDSSAGVTATKSLPVSTVTGTLTDFALGSADGIKLVENDTTSVFYLPYTAKDMAGNETKSFDLVRDGLIDSLTVSGTQLVSSLTNVIVSVVKDPTNSKNAAIEVRYTAPTTNNSMDMPLTITAMTYTGKNTSVQTVVTKAKAIDKIVLLAPADVVAAGDGTVEIPYEAYDAAGNLVKGYSYVSRVNLSGGNGVGWVEKSNGDAKLVFTAPTSKGAITFTATTPSSKISNMLSINVQDAAHPASLALNAAGFVTAMENTSFQKIDFAGGTGEDLIVYDQYDRAMSDDDINAALDGSAATGPLASGNHDYRLVATTSNQNLGFFGTDAGADNIYTGGGEDIGTDVGPGTSYSLAITTAADLRVFASNASGGVSTLEFTLTDFTDTKTLDTASTSFSVIKTADVDSYTINSSSAPIYAVLATGDVIGNTTARSDEYAFNATVYGATAAGTKVYLTGKPVVGTSLTNTTDFVVTAAGTLTYSGVYVTAKDLTNNRTTASTELVVTVSHNGVVKPLKVAITSSTTAPVAKEITLEGDDVSSAGVVTVDNDTVVDSIVQLYTAAGADNSSAKYYFQILDSYDTNGMLFSKFRIAKVLNAAGTNITSGYAGASIDNNGLLDVTAGSMTAGDEIYITAVTNNGLSATMKLIVVE